MLNGRNQETWRIKLTLRAYERNALSYLVPATESIQYTARMENPIKANTKVFWSYVLGLKKPCELLSEMYFKDRKVTIIEDIAPPTPNLFSQSKEALKCNPN